MSTDVLSEFRKLVMYRRPIHSGTQWENINCVACGDSRHRLGFFETPTGGFRFKCFNGGCEYQLDPTGWEPGSGLGGRLRRLFELLGGNILDLPLDLLRKAPKLFDADAVLVGEEHLQAIYDFPSLPLPEGAELLVDAQGADARAVRDYVNRRGSFFLDKYPFYWSPATTPVWKKEVSLSRYVIVPLLHTRGRIVGWKARAIDRDARYPHVKCKGFPQHYMLNQHRANERSLTRLFVVESEFDAIALDGLATFESKLTQNQQNFLRMTGKDIVMIPDYQKTEWKSYLKTAHTNYWYVAIPQWPGTDGGFTKPSHIKDVGESIQRNSLLGTIEAIIANMTRNYEKAEMLLMMYSSSSKK